MDHLNIGDPIIMRNKVWYRHGQVTAFCDQSRSYKVRSDNSRILERNRKFLKTGVVSEQKDVNIEKREASKINGDLDFQIRLEQRKNGENNMRGHTDEMHSTNI